MTDPFAPIVKTIAIDAEPAEVWHLLTTLGMIPQWMPDEELTVSLEGGGVRANSRTRHRNRWPPSLQP